MTYPTVTQYAAMMLNPKGRFRTLRGVSAVLDELGEPIFKASRHSVIFVAMIDQRPCTIRLFTSEKGSRNYDNILKNEVYMECDGDKYFDIAIDTAFDTTDVAPKETSERKMSENRIATLVDDIWGFKDENGKIVVDPIYISVEDFREGRAVVHGDSGFGLIDPGGKAIIAPIWDEMSYDGSHLCYVEREGMCGVVDRMGRQIVAPEWDWTGEFSHGMLLVEKDQKYGFVDMNGEIAIAIELDNATSFDNNGYSTITFQGAEYQIDRDRNRV